MTSFESIETNMAVELENEAIASRDRQRGRRLWERSLEIRGEISREEVLGAYIAAKVRHMAIRK